MNCGLFIDQFPAYRYIHVPQKLYSHTGPGDGGEGEVLLKNNLPKRFGIFGIMG